MDISTATHHHHHTACSYPNVLVTAKRLIEVHGLVVTQLRQRSWAVREPPHTMARHRCRGRTSSRAARTDSNIGQVACNRLSNPRDSHQLPTHSHELQHPTPICATAPASDDCLWRIVVAKAHPSCRRVTARTSRLLGGSPPLCKEPCKQKGAARTSNPPGTRTRTRQCSNSPATA